jgi:nicotinic acid phosphoribosyltransferase
MRTRFSPVAPLFHIDSYKLDHRRVAELAGHVEKMYSNFTNRGSRIEDIDHVVHFGLRAFLQNYAIDSFVPFFEASEDEVAALYEERVTQVVGPNDIGSDHIRALHRLGYLPLQFAAVPEGTPVPLRVPSFTVENTIPEFHWLTNYIESVLSSSVWQASTSATIAHRLRKYLDKEALETSGQIATVDWQGHDFSYRGMSSSETAAASGAGHLLSFTGTDSLVSLDWVDYFYPSEYGAENGLIGGSVPATEHSVMCVGIETLGERELFNRTLDLYPTGIFSMVSDTFNLWTVLTDFLPSLKEKILARDGRLVVRPDSGDPVLILTGNPDAEAGSPENKGVVQLLWETFGGNVNEQGYKELDTHVGVIYGDSITFDRAHSIIEKLKENGFASTNVVLGVGSFTYQYNTRDTFASAMKATYTEVDGKAHNLRKDPITDSGLKKSATGRLAVALNDEGDMYLIENATAEQEAASLLQPVWKDGKFITTQSFADVRKVLADSKF